ncbi:hypothetical protein MNBD_NITROSPIRAE03-586, partial [hydrothermal vent metagenome]
STNVDINSITYDQLLRLEAEGLIRSGILTTKPLNRNEVARLILEAERNSEGRRPHIRQIINSLKESYSAQIEGAKYIKPVDTLYGKYVYSGSNNSSNSSKILNYNNNGDLYKKGANFRFGFSSNVDLGFFSFHMNPELRYSGNDIDLIMKRIYGTLDFLGLELELGKDSQWWGPGYHGAMLFSNNPEPMTMIKLGNPHPFLLPWIFKYLGLVKFTTFLTQLEADRAFPEPYFWGLRVNLKPVSYFEIGVERTFFLGGRGEDEDFRAWYKTMTFVNGYDIPKDGPDVPNDQHVGADVKITLPFKWQPFQLYGELVAEDISRNITIKGGYLAGIYLPRIFNVDAIDLRMEYARTRKILYTHKIYRSGYTYKRRLIGHHMGNDATDLFVGTSLYGTGSTKYSFYYDREKKGLTKRNPEVSQEFVLALRQKVSERTDLSLKGGYEKVRDSGNIPGTDTDNIVFEISFDSSW